MKFRIFCLSIVSSLILACSPKIYLIDRQTILEEESAGDWPDFEKEAIKKSQTRGPTPYTNANPENRTEGKKAKLYRVLNGEMTSPARSDAHHAKK